LAGDTLDGLDTALSPSSIPGVTTAWPFPSSSRLGNDEGAYEGADEGESDGDREVVVAAPALVSVDSPVIVGGAVLMILMSRKAL
jgi:hypothetical protein